MIIRIKKIHVFLLALILVSVSFLFTIKNERIEKTVSVNQGLNLPVVMYHHVTESPEKAGKYIVTTEELEKDFVYLNEHGYKTVTVRDLIEYTESRRELPQKIIMITFDDGFKSVYKLALPLMEKYNIKAVIAPVGIVTEEYTINKNTDINYSYMTWQELEEMNENPLTEVQSHSYNMHKLSKDGTIRNGMAEKKGETKEEYKKSLTDDLMLMEKNLFEKSNVKPAAIAYPYGVYSKNTLEIIKELGYKSNFLCEERINTIIKGDKDSLYNLGRYNRASGVKTEDFFKKMKVF